MHTLILALALACAPDLGEATLATRPTAVACDPRPLPPEPECLSGTGAPNECTAHADCTDGDSGTCFRGGSYGQECLCAYDQCTTDADCGGTAVCACASNEDYQRVTNTCLASDCLADADCASGRCQANRDSWCGTASPDDVLPVTGWACATPEDTCNGDEDCDVDDGERCFFHPQEGLFRCSDLYAAACD